GPQRGAGVRYPSYCSPRPARWLSCYWVRRSCALSRPWAGNSPPYFEAKFWGTENKPSSTLTTGNVGVNIVKVIQ
ncbi:hypothetical protein NQ317_013672, partial [Molorchus minor]